MLTELEKETPVHYTAAVGPRVYVQGPHVTYGKKFLVFNVVKIFVKIFVHNEIYR